MKFRTMPRTDLVLSEVGFGVWTVATNWWGKIEDADKKALLENAVEESDHAVDLNPTARARLNRTSRRRPVKRQST